jgi:O-antigen ligase
MFTKAFDKLPRAGFLLLLITLFLVSFPRSWSLWPLGFFLGTGLALWITDFNNHYLQLKKYILVVLPPVIYFLMHLVSVLVQGGSVIMLVDRLMFLLVPVFGLPLFILLTSEDKILIFKVFIAGIISVTIILIIRILIFVHKLVPEDMSFFEYSVIHRYWYFTAYLSVFENPTYLSMKIIWVLLIFILIYDRLKINITITLIISVVLSVFIFFLSSRASIVFWLLTIIFFLIRLSLKRVIKPVLLLLFIPFILVLTGISVRQIPRVRESVNDIRVKLSKGNIDWKNIDQRTREWYTAIQIIKEKPLAGAGYVKIKDRIKDEYLRNGFYEEAKLQMNAHNQFLEAQMTFGIAGTLSLLWMLLTPLLLRKRFEYPQLAVALVLMMSFFLMFESMFNRQWGIMFFLLFYFILFTSTGMNHTTRMKDTVINN